MKLTSLIAVLILVSVNAVSAVTPSTAFTTTTPTPNFAPDSLGHSAVCYLPVVLTNNQAAGTSPNLPVLLTLNSSTYSTIEAANLSNVNFQDGASNILASWLESGETNASTSTNYWIKLPPSIASNATATVYLVFYGAGVNSKDASVTGTEPLWADGTYGQYDTGPAVFSFYDNFQGVSLAASWHGDANSTQTVNNGLTIQSNQNAWYGIYNNAVLPVPGIVESLMSQSGRSGFGTIGSNNANTTWTGGSISFQERTASAAGEQWWIAAPGTRYGTHAGNASLGTQYLVTGIARSSPNSSTLQLGYGAATVSDTDTPTNALNVFLGTYGTALTYGATFFQWVRTRSYPPSGVLPSVALGTVNCVAPTPIASFTPTPTPTFTPIGTATGLAPTPIPTASASSPLPGATPIAQLTLPIEILGPAGFTQTVSINIPDPSNITSLWIQAHGLSTYADKGSVRLNGGPWINLDNTTAQAAYPENHYGGVGGAYHTIRLTIPLPAGAVQAGSNTLDFRFNKSDGISIGWRVLKLNFKRSDGTSVLADSAFIYDDPNYWTPPLNDAADIAAGQALWNGARLTDISGEPILAACANCHASDGRDLKYFNYSNWAITARSMAHGLTLNQGQQIASYIRSLDLALPSGLTQHDLGRPWNPPYQPGPGLDSKPVEAWAAGAGIDWVLDNDNSMLPYMFPNGTSGPDAEMRTSTKYALNPREIPIAMPFQDWNHWLPVTHPMDSAYKVTATSDVRDSWNKSSFIRQYNYVVNLLSQPALVSSLMSQTHANMLAGNCAEGILTQVRAFNPWYLEGDTSSSFMSTANKDLPNLDFMSGRQLFIVRMWELHQRFKLEGHGKDVFGFPGGGHDRTWFFNDWTAFGVSPHITTDGHDIYPYDTDIKEKLASSVWYQLQLTINSGNKVAVPGYPMDWNYQSNHVDGVGLLSGHYHGLQLLLGEIIGMQEAAGTNAWEQCNTTMPGRFYYAPKNHNPSRAIFEPGEVCVGPDYMQLDPTVWRDITELMTKSFVQQIRERSPSQFPRKDTAPNTTLESASYLPTFDPSRPLCGVDDVSIGGNIYRSLETMKNIGVDPTVIESLASWGKAMWPLGNWDYWK